MNKFVIFLGKEIFTNSKGILFFDSIEQAQKFVEENITIVEDDQIPSMLGVGDDLDRGENENSNTRQE